VTGSGRGGVEESLDGRLGPLLGLRL
jgi:hypothetical protein